MKLGNFNLNLDVKGMINQAKETINTKKQESENYERLMQSSLKFVDFTPITINDKDKNMGRIYEINNKCPSVNIENATKIDNLLPDLEYPICVVYVTQDLDNTPFTFVMSQNKLWVIATGSYRLYEYNQIQVQVVSRGLMNQKIYFNNIMLSLFLRQNELEIFMNYITNAEYRQNYINKDLEYLCGITPIYQCINKIGSGISIDKDKNIVFHDKKMSNYKYNYDEIQDYDMLADTNIVLRKRQFNRNSTMKANTSSCTSVSLRITLKDQRQVSIPLLEPSSFNSTYSTTGGPYKEAYEFGKTIIEKIDSLNPNQYL